MLVFLEKKEKGIEMQAEEGEGEKYNFIQNIRHYTLKWGEIRGKKSSFILLIQFPAGRSG